MDKERPQRRTSQREHEPGLPDSLLNASGGPIAALLREPFGVQGGRSFGENFADFQNEQSPCLALARSDRQDGIRTRPQVDVDGKPRLH
ncbi:MAG: hypothetical protein R3D27_04925 [Hyphomicrobiaceae bacterium]